MKYLVLLVICIFAIISVVTAMMGADERDYPDLDDS